jgi:deoxyribonuclease IV
MARFLGAHTSDSGGLHMTARRAGSAGMTALQIFTAIPKFYGDKSNINAERAQRFRDALAETDVRPEHVVVHAAYVLSVATADAAKWERAAAGLAKEMERSSVLDVGQVCFHPGSASDGDPEAAAERVARAMVQALERTPDSRTRLLVENTAGAGRTLGRTATEVGAILAHVPQPLRSRVGYGLDTCHLFASGYDIHTSADRLGAILDEFEDAAGEPPSFLHLNDSATEFASNRDRHMNIGEGQIGVEPFRWLFADRRSQDVPLILETPEQEPEPAPDDPAADPWHVAMLELLRGFDG